MKAHFEINEDYYNDKRKIITVFLSKLTEGRAGTFTEGWYMKLNNPNTLDSEQDAKKLFNNFEKTFILRDIQD